MIQVSFSGGRSSAMMAKLLLDSCDEELVFTFANTGKELPETLQFVKDCQDHWGIDIVWVEYITDKPLFKVVDFDTASRNGEPFEMLIGKKKALPNAMQRWCTSDLKIKPMKRYLKSLGHKRWDAAIGIRADERHRKVKIEATRDVAFDYIFPLIGFQITKEDVIKFWDSQPFNLAIDSSRSNCDHCFMKGKQTKANMERLYPGSSKWWSDMEKKTGHTFRSEYSVDDYVHMANEPTLFDVFDEPNISCFCNETV